MVRRPWLAAIVVAVVTLTACAAPRPEEASSVAPEGRQPVLGPGPWFSLEIMPRDWIVEGAAGTFGSQVSVQQKQNIPALRVVNGRKGFLLVRRIRAFLLATPFLSWSWNMEPQGGGLHPIRLIVGFNGGAPNRPSGVGETLTWMGSSLPPYDRILAVTYGDSALLRGSLIVAGADYPVPPRPEQQARYVIRGGRENADTWWLETVDLSKFYASAWPGDRLDKVEVVFIGVAAAGGRSPAAAHFSGIVLSR